MESKILGTEVIISFSHPEDKTIVKLIKTVNNIDWNRKFANLNCINIFSDCKSYKFGFLCNISQIYAHSSRIPCM